MKGSLDGEMNGEKTSAKFLLGELSRRVSGEKSACNYENGRVSRQDLRERSWERDGPRARTTLTRL